MIAIAGAKRPKTGNDALHDEYFRTRLITEAVCKPLGPEDMVLQSMPDCSPAKWHLAHTTWFFEQMVLAGLPAFRPFNPGYSRLFNSYYELDQPAHPRHARGLLSRPVIADVIAYRRHVDAAVLRLISSGRTEVELEHCITLGLHHEQQHQELLLTDILHLFSKNPLHPVYRPLPSVTSSARSGDRTLRYFAGGAVRIGACGVGFSFDNERPCHTRLVPPFQLASRLVTNAEYAEFIRDRGYQRRELWMSAGWEALRANGASRPLYWSEDLDAHFTLGGLVDLDPQAPVAHVSYFEADAFARWSEARLPREDEWELVASGQPVAGNFLEHGALQPLPVGTDAGQVAQMFGDVWEWTQSPYVAYPGFRPELPPLDQYNAQFMVNQMVLRGGSCFSPAAHIRASYRNYLPPHARWQASGIRLARDA